MIDADDLMPELDRRLHQSLLEGVLATGSVPSPEDLVASIGIDPAELPQRLAALAAADYLAVADSGRITCLYPFSPSPTPHAIIVDGRRRYAMCSIDALGVAAMVGQAVTIEGRCEVCGTPIRIDVAPGTVTRADPAETVVLARRSSDEPACETCCPFTLFACGPEHGQEAAARLPETAAVSLAEALRHAESIFADHLGETLPARRRRSRLAESHLQT